MVSFFLYLFMVVLFLVFDSKCGFGEREERSIFVKFVYLFFAENESSYIYRLISVAGKNSVCRNIRWYLLVPNLRPIIRKNSAVIANLMYFTLILFLILLIIVCQVKLLKDHNYLIKTLYASFFNRNQLTIQLNV